jgi:hypothetical protein
MGVCSVKASSRVKKDQQGRVLSIGETAGAKVSAHENGGPTGVLKGSCWLVSLFFLPSFLFHTEIKGLCMCTYSMLTNSGSLTHS